MKKFRTGFTLVELLIVIAILGSFSAMMATSSSDSIDASAAAAIVNNLQTMKAAAFQMYQDRTDIASLTAIANDTDIDGTDGAGTEKVGEALGSFLGRKDIAPNYGIVGTGDTWFVYYTITTNDSAKVKAKLLASATAVGLYAQTVAENAAPTVAGFANYYTTVDTENCIALKVR